MSQATGRLERCNGTKVVFSTKARGEWSPMELDGTLDPDDLVIGNYYVIDYNKGVVFGLSQAPERGSNGEGPVRARAQAPRPSQPSTASDKAYNLRLSMCGFANSWIQHHGALPEPSQIYKLRELASAIYDAAMTAQPSAPAKTRQETQADLDEDIPF